jgi:hypothetical protein
MVPVRAAPLLELTSKLTVPSPTPALPLVIVIHPTVLAAVHAQLLSVATVSRPLPPEAGIV